MASPTGYNHLSVQVYDAYTGVTPIADPLETLDDTRIQVVRLEKLYPGGLFGGAEFWIASDIRQALSIREGLRIVVFNGLKPIWDGTITSIGPRLGQGNSGFKILAVGYWGDLLGRRTINKPWAENRITDAVWEYRTGTTGGGDAKCTFDRSDRLRFTPKAVAWGNGDLAAVRITAPTGQTWKAIEGTLGMQKGAQTWGIRVWNVDTAASVALLAASGTAALSHTFASPPNAVELQFLSGAAQTPAADGSIYGELTGAIIYTETGSINLTEIAKDVRALVSELSTDESGIASNTLSLVPFVTDGPVYLSEVLKRAYELGDSSFNAWAAYLDVGDASGLPRLVVEQQPVLTDFDYQISIDDLSFGAVELVRSRGDLYNYIIVTYTDELGNRVVITPADDAALTSTLSVEINKARRDYILALGTVSAAVALGAGKAFLAAHKDPYYYVGAPIGVRGYVSDRYGAPVAASEIRPGKRLKLIDFISDLASVSGAGLTQLITGVSYTDSTETASLSLGVPDNLAVMLAQLLRR